MNALTASRANAQTGHGTAKLKWLLRREYWENRGGFFWAPLLTGAIGMKTKNAINEMNRAYPVKVSTQPLPMPLSQGYLPM